MSIPELHDLFLETTGVSTDTRQIAAGNMFFALKGPSFNGNEFAKKALDAGAAYAVVDEAVETEDSRLLRVDSVLASLQELARYHRRRFKGPVIALTGSNGKTTTKELMAAVLSAKYRIIATHGNLNNHIGVPLTLLRISNDTEIAIVEMGANHVGEIALLCSLAEPDHGLITNIGKAHIGTFGGFENILRGKTELFDFLIRHDGIIFLNTADKALAHMERRIKDPRTYPESGEHYTRPLRSAPFLSYTDETGAEVQTGLVGDYNLTNVAAAKTVGQEFGISATDANLAISGYSPKNNRSQLVRTGNRQLIMDAYNANPSSMALAIDNFSRIDAGASAKLMILGDMLELGEEEAEEHRKIGIRVKGYGIRALYVGKLMHSAFKADPGGKWFPTREELREFLLMESPEAEWILIKGSRGMRLEEAADIL